MNRTAVDEQVHLLAGLLRPSEIWQQPAVMVVMKPMRVDLTLPFARLALKQPQAHARAVQQDAPRH